MRARGESLTFPFTHLWTSSAVSSFFEMINDGGNYDSCDEECREHALEHFNGFNWNIGFVIACSVSCGISALNLALKILFCA